MSDHAEAIAELLVAAHRSGAPVAEPPAMAGPRDRAEAYAVQDLVRALLGPTGGWKTGAPGPKDEPIAAPMLTSLIAEAPAALPAARFHRIGVEAELAFRLARDLPPRDAPWTEDEVADAIESVHPAIEVVDSRLGAWAEQDAMWKLADNQVNGYFLYGPAVSDWRGRDLEHAPVELVIDGAVAVAHEAGGNPAGDPLRLTTWLANHLAAGRGGLKAGDIVTTGSCTGLIWVEPGASIRARFPGIGEATAEFTK